MKAIYTGVGSLLQNSRAHCKKTVFNTNKRTNNHYFMVSPKVDQRAGQLSLPHVGIKQKKI